MLANNSIQMKRNKNGMCIKESNFSCSYYPHIVVIITINILGWGNEYDNTEKKSVTVSKIFFF